jgi:hypothetical protein
MYCTACGTSRPEGMNVCPNCGTAAPAFAVQPTIQNYLVPAILITLCCFVPAGIVAIVYAAQVNSKLAAGDIVGAQASARLAKIWCWAGFGSGLLVGILCAIFAIFGLAGALSIHH